jgi:preprotein translocase subunit SecF
MTMQLLKGKLAIDFMGKRRYAMILSAVVLLISIGALVTKGLNFGVDFTGGTLIEVGYPEAVELEGMRDDPALRVRRYSILARHAMCWCA